jgi:DNA mismatch repair ATPase MutS
LEEFSYQRTPHLKAFCRPFLEAAQRPSRHLARITRLLLANGVQGNPLLRLAINIVLPWDAMLIYLLDRAKGELAEHAPAWMGTWFELEALCSLANLAYLNPGYTFPEIVVRVREEPTPVLGAEGLGHPLIPYAGRVSNDLSISALGQVTMITGSNMAGKSVFLKTVGANLALAYAGGPVTARSLRTIPFRLFTSMAISDSVTDGISYFYAEVKRLRALLHELSRDHRMPVLYCIDEIFRGTNNRERLLGSRAYVSSLVGKRGLGFIATHDLELARLADESPHIVNYHFRDHVQDGRMVFDFILRPGPSPTTNALTIMALEGLPTPPTGNARRGPGEVEPPR